MTNENKIEPKKKIPKWLWVVGGIFLFIIMITFIGNGEGGKEGVMLEEKVRTETEVSQPIQEEIPSKPREWQRVFDLTASANKQSDTFSFEGGRQRIIYKTTGGDMALCAIYVMKEGTSLMRDGGFPVVTIQGSKSNETMMRKNAGDYYLDLMVANGTCTVEIQEYR